MWIVTLRHKDNYSIRCYLQMRTLFHWQRDNCLFRLFRGCSGKFDGLVLSRFLFAKLMDIEKDLRPK